MLQQLCERLSRYKPPASPVDAAVLIALTREPVPRVLLTKRAGHMNSHAGEVAFPGGKCDAADLSVVATALREAHEEVGLLPRDVKIIGELGVFTSRLGLKVKPIVGLLDTLPELTGNPEEVDSIFTVQLDFFLQQPPSYDHKIKFMGMNVAVPSFNYQGYVIWGLTGYMIVELLRRVYDAEIDWRWPNPLKK